MSLTFKRCHLDGMPCAGSCGLMGCARENEHYMPRPEKQRETRIDAFGLLRDVQRYMHHDRQCQMSPGGVKGQSVYCTCGYSELIDRVDAALNSASVENKGA